MPGRGSGLLWAQFTGLRCCSPLTAAAYRLWASKLANLLITDSQEPWMWFNPIGVRDRVGN
jgi:hypothetical protein